VDTDVGAGLELVDGFCCLGGMLRVNGDADAAVGARVGLDGMSSVGWCHCLPTEMCQ